MLRIGSLFSGVGGLDMAVEAFFEAETVWHCEVDQEPSKVLAARWPGVPNLGDITTVDWSSVEPVDILCGGFPCQDLSLAGRRKGIRPGTRSGLWADFRNAIEALRPSVVIIENVRGLLSGCAESDSDMEPCPGCVGDGQHRPLVRALGRCTRRPCRPRVRCGVGFSSRVRRWRPAWEVPGLRCCLRQGVRFERGWPARGRRGEPADGRGGAPVALLPTPSASSPNEEEDLEGWQTRRDRIKAEKKNGNGFGVPLGIAVRLMSTPQVADAEGGHVTRSGDAQGNVVGEVNWGAYEPAVRRWEALTRTAPAPTVPDGKTGAHRLSPHLPEWMMGYPAGWVTDVLTRNPAIKACGNGVVPQQAYAALGGLWGRVLESIAA